MNLPCATGASNMTELQEDEKEPCEYGCDEDGFVYETIKAHQEGGEIRDAELIARLCPTHGKVNKDEHDDTQ